MRGLVVCSFSKKTTAKLNLSFNCVFVTVEQETLPDIVPYSLSTAK